MPDLAPTAEQVRIAREGTDSEKRDLVRDPAISDAVRLLFIRDLPHIAAEAVRYAQSDDTRLEFARFSSDWVLCVEVAR